MLARSGRTHTSYRRDQAFFSVKSRWVTVPILGVILLLLPKILSTSDLSIADVAWTAIMGAVALNLLTGYAGQVSLGQAAFSAYGAYTAVFAMRTLGVGMLIGVPLGGLVAALAGLLVGLPSLRFRGFYLSLTTLALQYITVYLLGQYQTHNGGIEGFSLSSPSIGPIHLDSDTAWYYALGVITVIVLLIIGNLVRSRTGRAFMAVRDRDAAAAIVGVNVRRTKLLAFMISSFFVGVAGALAAYYLGQVSIESYSLNFAISYVAMIIIGGLGSIVGSVIGAIVISWLPFWISDIVQGLPSSSTFVQHLQGALPGIQSAVYGLIIVLFLVFEPRGLVEIFRRVKRWTLLWPFQHREENRE